MKVELRRIRGPWREGWVLDKHTISSTYMGDNQYGRPVFDTLRTEVGEASFQLKYRREWDQARPLAQAIADHIYPKLPAIGFIVPMPASKPRPRQPVSLVASELSHIVGIPMFDELLVKAQGGKSLKDLGTKQDKIEAIGNSLSVKDVIQTEGSWNVLLVDDLHNTGASMEAACNALSKYRKVNGIFVAALTWS